MVAYDHTIGKSVEGERPSSYQNVVNSKESTAWLTAMNEENESFIKNYTWELVQLPKNNRVVGYK